MAAPGASGPGSASNPRKFSEKIALQRQRQAEETAAFEEVMMDIGSTRVQPATYRDIRLLSFCNHVNLSDQTRHVSYMSQISDVTCVIHVTNDSCRT